MTSGCQLLVFLLTVGGSVHAVRNAALGDDAGSTLGFECYCTTVSSEADCPNTGADPSPTDRPDLHRWYHPEDKACCMLQYDRRTAHMMLHGKPGTPPGPEYAKQSSLAKCSSDTRSFPKRRCCRVLAGYDEAAPVIGFYVGRATAVASMNKGRIKKIKPRVTKDDVLGGKDSEGHLISWQEVFQFLDGLKKKDMLPNLECLADSIEDMQADERPCNLYK